MAHRSKTKQDLIADALDVISGGRLFLQERKPSSGEKTPEVLQEKLEKAGDLVQRQHELLRRLSAYPFGYAPVVSLLENQESPKETAALIVYEGKLLEVGVPEGIALQCGNIVKISPMTHQIIDVAEAPPLGEVATVRHLVDPVKSEVDQRGVIRVVLNGKFSGSLENGDRVVLDSASAVILGRLNKEEDRFRFTEETKIDWDDIGGLEEAKDQLKEAIEFPYLYPELYAFHKLGLIKGVLLYGPPGCGKTMLGKAAATAIARIHKGKGAGTAFMYVKGPEILDRYVGSAEATIRQIFEMARAHKKKHGYPAILFLDEAEAILYKRGTGVSSDVERTIVPQFLAEMDGLEESGAIVLLATNREDILDPAVVRHKRIDCRIKVTRPTRKSAPDILESNLKKIPLAGVSGSREMAEWASQEFFSSHRVLYEIAVEGEAEKKRFTLAEMVDGAMLAAVAEKANSIVFHRNRRAGSRDEVTKNDIKEAIDKIFVESKDLDHADMLEDFTRDFKDKIIGVKKLTQTTV